MPPAPPVDPTAPEPGSGKKAWLLIATGVVAIAVLAVAATRPGDGAREAQAVDPLPAAAPTTASSLDPDPTASSVPPSSDATTPETGTPDATTGTTEPEAASGEPDEADDVSSCTWAGNEIIIALVNNSSKTSTYWVTTAYLDADGRRVADEIHFVNAVRSNETAFEVSPSLEHATPTCEVIDVQRWAEESDPAEMNEVGACDMEAPDIFGHASARLTAANGSTKISDYVIKVAFVNAGGFRVGSGTALIDSVRPGESAPGDVFSFAAPEGIARCDVVAVERTASR
jgi:hypothetical protein